MDHHESMNNEDCEVIVDEIDLNANECKSGNVLNVSKSG